MSLHGSLSSKYVSLPIKKGGLTCAFSGRRFAGAREPAVGAEVRLQTSLLADSAQPRASLARPSHHDWLFTVYLRKSERAFTQIIFIVLNHSVFPARKDVQCSISKILL